MMFFKYLNVKNIALLCMCFFTISCSSLESIESELKNTPVSYFIKKEDNTKFGDILSNYKYTKKVKYDFYKDDDLGQSIKAVVIINVEDINYKKIYNTTSEDAIIVIFDFFKAPIDITNVPVLRLFEGSQLYIRLKGKRVTIPLTKSYARHLLQVIANNEVIDINDFNEIMDIKSFIDI